ncbi:MAG: phytoene desaturase family protein, partial [Candidatus Dormibacteria bacterium]
MPDAVVVGSGPNGLAAAVAIARAGFSVTVLEAAERIGGGTRTRELTVPGVLHDVCSAVHPMGFASPFLRSLPLEDHGLEWRWAELDLAHPLEGGRAGVMQRSLARTVAGLGPDGDAWRRLFGPHAEAFDDLAEDLLRPLQHVPRHPVALTRFGLRALQPATLLARHLRTEPARALFAGVAAHAIQPLDRPTTSAVGLMLIAAGHHGGWPVAAGGSRAVTDALASLLTSLGGRIETGVRVSSLRQLPDARVTLLDVTPQSLVAIAGERLPARIRAQLSRWRFGPAAFKLDLAVEGGVPWAAEECRRAGTVHVGGTLEEIARAEREVHRGRMPERPFVLVGQQYLADPRRSAGDVHPVWAYAHVPHAYGGDAIEAIIAQLERFAPGVRERIVARHVLRPADLEAYDSNYAGGDIASGANDPWQVVIRPRLAADPYATGIPGVFL